MKTIVLIKDEPCVSITVNKDMTTTKASRHSWNFSHPSGFVVCDKCKKVYAETTAT